jgi:hypothetical protein
MSAANLPLPEPPTEDVADLTDRLTAARIYRDDAARTLALLRRDLAEDADGSERRTMLVIEVDLGERRLLRWGMHIERLEARARARGIRS